MPIIFTYVYTNKIYVTLTKLINENYHRGVIIKKGEKVGISNRFTVQYRYRVYLVIE